jgi:LysR family glycine cleavage system transcriptional activator
MKRLMPPLHLLRAFTTTARFGSVSRACEALNLSQSAVSKQIAELERLTGVLLFERVRQRLTLTPGGLRYEVAVRQLLTQLEAATLELITGGDGGGTLHLSTLPTFGAKWLIPRLPEFQRQHPHIELHYVPYAQGYDFHREDLDCAILFGNGQWPGARADYLTGREVVLIAPPVLAAQPPLDRAQDIAGFTLLQHVSVPHAWTHWCAAHGVSGVNPLMGPQLDQYHSLIRAVRAGMGLALVPHCLVQDDIAAGLVSTPLDDGYMDEMGYYLCYPESRSHLKPLSSFRQWLLNEVQRTLPPSPTRPECGGPPGR